MSKHHRKQRRARIGRSAGGDCNASGSDDWRRKGTSCGRRSATSFCGSTISTTLKRVRRRPSARKPNRCFLRFLAGWHRQCTKPGLTWENSLTTACRFIMASIVLVDAITTITRASNFLAARDFAFTASLCYAKIAPGALHRGDFDGHCCEHTETAGAMPKSEVRDFVGVMVGAAAPTMQAPRMARS